MKNLMFVMVLVLACSPVMAVDYTIALGYEPMPNPMKPGDTLIIGVEMGANSLIVADARISFWIEMNDTRIYLPELSTEPSSVEMDMTLVHNTPYHYYPLLPLKEIVWPSGMGDGVLSFGCVVTNKDGAKLSQEGMYEHRYTE